MIGGFNHDALHASTAVGGSITATPTGILSLDPMALSYWFCRSTMFPRTSLLPYPKVHVS